MAGANRDAETRHRISQHEATLEIKAAFLTLGQRLLANQQHVPAEVLVEAMTRAAFDLMSDAAGPAEAARLIRGLASELEHIATIAGNARERTQPPQPD